MLNPLRLVHPLAKRFLDVPVVGLDISDRSVKFIKFSGRGRHLRVEQLGIEFLPEEVVQNGEIKNPEELVKGIEALGIKSSGVLRERFVVAALPEEKSFLRIIQVPFVKLEQIDSTVRWELEGNIPLPPEEVYFDYEVIRGEKVSGTHFDVLIIAFPRAIVDAYVSVIKAAGLIPLAFELESQSIARALINRLDPEQPKVFVDFGASRTSLVLIGSGSIALTSTIAVSGVKLTEAIAKALGVSVQKADEIKRTVGLREDLYEGKVYEALKPMVDILAEEIGKNIEFYRDHFVEHHHGQTASSDVESVVFTGGDSSLTNLDAYLARALKKPVLIADSFTALKGLLGDYLPPISRKDALKFTTAIGLALRETDV
ncbi:MAG: type IV pilus assembly protein PilM [Candidatus Sungbacteria bacterium]|uniref:Type IV pilus assembly protein PilM n=1 Tax=Candidatus Sungiibacteriota bacterium TaxID=2750080 RepID=A0A9D6LTX3_9BACT|nr:type IV pilus assembly protein PilM [Candidatus Sungbacteria bacterium]